MGYCGTMGAEYIQYMLSDSIVTPREFRAFYQEKIIALPHSYFVNDHRQSARAAMAVAGEKKINGGIEKSPMSRAQYGLPDDVFVFCNFNQLYKIDPSIFDVWMRVLRRVPRSVLWLLRFPPVGEGNILKEVCTFFAPVNRGQNFLHPFHYCFSNFSVLPDILLRLSCDNPYADSLSLSSLIAPSLLIQALKRGVRIEQIIFSDVAPREEHVRRGALADLFLDTPACNAHTTACDILWSGTPMLTLMGDKMATRVGASLLLAAGLEELVTTSYGQYEELAVTLALDTRRLLSIRRHLELSRDTSAAFDTARWVANMEQGLRLVWDRHTAGLCPSDLDVIDTRPLFYHRMDKTIDTERELR